MTLQWSPQQDQAIKRAQAWAKGKGGQQVFRISGFAGTGKTTIAKEIASNIKDSVCYGAFTGKAASVMRRKGCDGASTIHSLIYRPKGKNRENPEWELNPDSEVRHSKLVIIDECSMVDEELGKDLLSYGTKVLVLGDPGQLPPIKGAGFFNGDNPDVMLTEIHRQALDNPIIRLSMLVREGGKLEPGVYGESRVITQSGIKSAQEENIDILGILKADQVIVGLNRTRQKYNQRIRKLLNRAELLPQRDDKLVCLRNNRKKNILNGTLWNVEKWKLVGNTVNMTVKSLEDEADQNPRDVQVRQEFFFGTESMIDWQELKYTQQFTYGYALTCHKSQGSQWNNLIIFDEGQYFKEDAARWRYTAITRAAEKLTMVV